VAADRCQQACGSSKQVALKVRHQVYNVPLCTFDMHSAQQRFSSDVPRESAGPETIDPVQYQVKCFCSQQHMSLKAQCTLLTQSVAIMLAEPCSAKLFIPSVAQAHTHAVTPPVSGIIEIPASQI